MFVDEMIGTLNNSQQYTINTATCQISITSQARVPFPDWQPALAVPPHSPIRPIVRILHQNHYNFKLALDM